jgi:hypothetical protein
VSRSQSLFSSNVSVETVERLRSPTAFVEGLAKVHSFAVVTGHFSALLRLRKVADCCDNSEAEAEFS